MKDYYKILRIEKFSSSEEIKLAYYTLAKQYHPDKNQNNKEFYSTYFREIKEAYEFLNVLDNKLKYDDICRFNPEMIETNSLVSQLKYEHTKPEKKTKSKLYRYLIGGIFVLMILYIGFLNKKLKVANDNSIDTNSSNYTNQQINKAGLHIEMTDSLNEVVVKSDSIRKSNISESKQLDEGLSTNQSNSKSVKMEPSSDVNSNKHLNITNYCDNISVNYSETQLIIYNKNKFSIDKVTVTIYYDEEEVDRITQLKLPVTEDKSFLEVAPGKDTWMMTSKRIKFVFIKSANDENYGSCD